MIKSHACISKIQWVQYISLNEAVWPKGIASGGSPIFGEFFFVKNGFIGFVVYFMA